MKPSEYIQSLQRMLILERRKHGHLIWIMSQSTLTYISKLKDDNSDDILKTHENYPVKILGHPVYIDNECTSPKIIPQAFSR